MLSQAVVCPARVAFSSSRQVPSAPTYSHSPAALARCCTMDQMLDPRRRATAAVRSPRYSWTTPTGDQEITGSWAPAPTTGTRGQGQKTLVLDREGQITQYGADEAARAVVENVSTRGDSYTLQAVACYWLRPGHTVQVDLANGSSARHIVKQVVFHLGQGSMTVTTREPNNLGEN